MTCKHLLNGSPDCVFCHRDQLKHELSLAEEGLANYAQENAQLRALLTQAPIAKVTVRESFGGDVLDWVMCAPGLPPGEHDLYLMPSVPQSAEQTCRFDEHKEACDLTGCPNGSPGSPAHCPLPWPKIGT